MDVLSECWTWTHMVNVGHGCIK